MHKNQKSSGASPALDMAAIARTSEFRELTGFVLLNVLRSEREISAPECCSTLGELLISCGHYDLRTQCLCPFGSSQPDCNERRSIALLDDASRALMKSSR